MKEWLVNFLTALRDDQGLGIDNVRFGLVSETRFQCVHVIILLQRAKKQLVQKQHKKTSLQTSLVVTKCQILNSLCVADFRH